MDDVTRDETFQVAIDEPYEDLDKVTCVKMSLRNFSIEDFRGGSAEKHLIKSILKNAPHLVTLNAKRCASVCKKGIAQAISEIKAYERLSETCDIIFDTQQRN
jgi:hypothetical protein